MTFVTIVRSGQTKFECESYDYSKLEEVAVRIDKGCTTTSNSILVLQMTIK